MSMIVSKPVGMGVSPTLTQLITTTSLLTHSLALHFHLSIANDSSISNPKTPSGMSYEEAEFAYEPFLDEARDKNILDLLPDYLCEDICFPRTQAVKFYDKIFETMSRRRGVD